MHCRRILALLLFAVLASVTVSKLRKLKIENLVEIPDGECERRSKKKDQLTIHYTGSLQDGTKFESSHDEGREPAVFQIGVADVIQGWDEGMLDMCVGEKRRLTIPASMGYGDTGQKHKEGQGSGSIPAGATIVFEVELLKLDDGPPPPNVFKAMDANGDNLLSQEEVSGFIREQEVAVGLRPSDDEEHNEMITDIFRNEDKDKDGHISEGEFSGLKGEAEHDEL